MIIAIIHSTPSCTFINIFVFFDDFYAACSVFFFFAVDKHRGANKK